MKNLIFAVTVLFAVIQLGLSIRCYQCAGKDCSTETDCTSGLDTCSFTHTKPGNIFARACNKKSLCDKAASACEKSKQCAMKCCQTDLCNGDGPTVAPDSPASTVTIASALIVFPLFSLIMAYF